MTIIRDHFEDFKNKRFERIAKLLEIDLETIKEILAHITKLNPKPGEGYASLVDNYIIPDLEVREEDGDYRILSAEHVFKDYQFSTEGRIALPE